MPLPLLASATAWLLDHLILVVGAIVVVAGLAVFGRTDLRRLSWTRIWAISGVCFSESIRRKVLWLLPLAILGLIAVVQLQQPTDEQDAIRETTKFCLLASGLVVVLSTLILACTNLPREIENRVIFTVVTKPTSRLEIIVGKIVGFARVSFTILLVMGLFTWGYLELRSRLLGRDLQARLAVTGVNRVETVSRPTLEHYETAGLLNAKRIADPLTMDIYGRPPEAGSRRRYLNPEGYLLVPFVLPPNLLAYRDPEGKQLHTGLQIHARVGYDPAPPAPPPPPGRHAPLPVYDPSKPPTLNVQVFDPNVQSVLNTQVVTPAGPKPVASADATQPTVIDVPTPAVAQLMGLRTIYVALSIAAGNQPLWIDVDAASPPVVVYAPVDDAPKAVLLTPVDFADPTKPGDPLFTGREGTFGQQVKGEAAGGAETCVYRFRDVRLGSAVRDTGKVPIELRAGVEKNGDVASEDVLTDMKLAVIDPASGKTTELPGVLHPENNRTLYADIPAELCASGNFDVAVRCYSAEQWLGLRPNSLSVVEAPGSFGLNLAKSLAILWLLSILVTTISVFSSTFLTWPTAVVFTLVLLFGRWGLNELGDAAAAGLGRQFTTDFGLRDPALVQTVAGSVDTLNKIFKAVASVLPDISAFSATDAIERGLVVPGTALLQALLTLFEFGLPLCVAAYVVLKNKEVAP